MSTFSSINGTLKFDPPYKGYAALLGLTVQSYVVVCGEVDCLMMTQAYFGGILVDLNQSNCCEFAKYGAKTIVNRLLRPY